MIQESSRKVCDQSIYRIGTLPTRAQLTYLEADEKIKSKVYDSACSHEKYNFPALQTFSRNLAWCQLCQPDQLYVTAVFINMWKHTFRLHPSRHSMDHVARDLNLKLLHFGPCQSPYPRTKIVVYANLTFQVYIF